MLTRYLPSNPRYRNAILSAAAVLATLFITQILLPGRGGGRGAPMAVVFSGLVMGLVNALTAAGLILIYRTSRIINFAHTAIGAAGAALAFHFLQFTGVPFLLAFILGLAFSGVLGLAFDIVFGRRFFNAPRLVLTVVTIAAAGLLGGAAVAAIDKLPFFPPVESRNLLDSAPDIIRSRVPFGAFHFQVGSLPLRFGFVEILAIWVSVIALVVVADFFRRTRAGVGVRAMSENLERATLLGVSVGGLSSIVWVLSGVLAGAGVTLSGLLTTPGSSGGLAPEVLLPALAAAVIGRMRSLPVTVGAAVLISVISRSFSYSLQNDLPLVDLGLFVVVGVGLLVQRKRMLRSEEASTSSWQATEEQRPIPKELLAIRGLRLTRTAFIALGLLGAGLFPFLTSTGATNLGGVIALNTIVALSLVVLTGWAGQVSLGQFAFAAIGAVVGGSLTTRAGVPFWIAVPIASAVTAGFAALVGLPALRIKGLFLGVSTFAFAIAVHSILFNKRYFGWMLPKAAVHRPVLFFVNFEDERSMYFLCVGALILALFLVSNVRRSRYGRIFIALRDNETNVQSFGITAVRAKLVAFAASGALAGFAGAIFAHQQRGLSVDTFAAQASVDVFLLAIIGGVGSVNGALLGSAYFNISRYIVTSPLFATLLGSGGTLYLLYASPGGLISIVNRMRDSVLRIVAQRRQLVVPSLFADYDPDALARRLIPLAPLSDNAGLATIKADERFTLATELYAEESLGEAAQERETTAIAAAAIAGGTHDAA
jgi:branched-chain amino acid transport system permease protein